MIDAGFHRVDGTWTDGAGRAVALTIGIQDGVESLATDLVNQVGNQLEAAGFERTVYRITAADWRDKALTGELSDRFDILIGRWAPGADGSVAFLLHTPVEGAQRMNPFGYGNPAMDARIDAMDALPPGEERDAAIAGVEAAVADELPYLRLFAAQRAGLYGVHVHAADGQPLCAWNVDTWTVEP
jgi:hypothetical protein